MCQAAGYEANNWNSNLQQQDQVPANFFDWNNLQNVDFSVLPDYDTQSQDGGSTFNTHYGNIDPSPSSSTGYYGHVGHNAPVYDGNNYYHAQDGVFPSALNYDGGGVGDHSYYMPPVQEASNSFHYHHGGNMQGSVESEALQMAMNSLNTVNPAHPSFQLPEHLHEMDVTPRRTHYPAGHDLSTVSKRMAAFRARTRIDRSAPVSPPPVVELTGDSDDEFFQPEKEANEYRAKIGVLWRRKGLWVGMNPRELAAGIAEIKVEIGSDVSMTTGPIAVNFVKKSPRANPTYIEEFQQWTKKFTKRIMLVEANIHAVFPNLTEEKRAALTIASVRFLQDRATYLWNRKSKNTKREKLDEMLMDVEAKKVWTALENSDELAYYNLNNGNPPSIGLQGLPMEGIEASSRHIEYLLPPYTSNDVANLLRRYMIRTLRKSVFEVDAFTKARNQWLKAEYMSQRARS